jgi:hypothetical protein
MLTIVVVDDNVNVVHVVLVDVDVDNDVFGKVLFPPTL